MAQGLPTNRPQYNSNSHIYMEVSELPGNKNASLSSGWEDRALYHPLSPLSTDDSEMSFMSQPIRKPLIAHQQQLAQQCQNNTNPQKHRQTNVNDVTCDRKSIHPSIHTQDCSMSSHSSSGYDSMVSQSPPLVNRNQRTIPPSNEPQYTANYDNVRGKLRGHFVTYNN